MSSVQHRTTECTTNEQHRTTEETSKDKLIKVLENQLEEANKSRANLEKAFGSATTINYDI